MLTFNTDSCFDKDIFKDSCLQAAGSSAPSLIGDIEYDPAINFELWLAEGDMRTAANSRFQKAHQAQHQFIPGQALTVDQLGRICEGPIELMLGLDVAAVLDDRTDARPHLTVSGVLFDVKGSAVRPENSFAIPCWKANSGRYDALLLVQHVRPGLARIWGCKCSPGAGWQERPAAMAGKKPFYRIACPDLASMH